MSTVAVIHEPDTIDSDDLYPRDAAHRYRLYQLDGRTPVCVGATPDPQGIGVALVCLAEDRRAAGLDPAPVGVLDAVMGRWLSSLWQPGLG